MKRVTLLGLLLVAVFSFAVLPNSTSCCVEAFFVSPTVDGVIESQIIEALDEAEKSIDIAMYSFTDDQLAAAVIRAYDRGVKVRILLEDSRKNEQGGEFTFLSDGGVQTKSVTEDKLFHHKFVVIDGSLTITGSYNWSDAADTRNFENVVFVSCEEIADRYVKEFEKVWNASE